jgi:phospholipid/cholesterol/gamma-HCH transport system ATP-binding protein
VAERRRGTLEERSPARSEDVAISVVGLTKRFGSQTIWEDVTFDIPKGQISVILGPSGTGKSVLLKHFVGLLKPTSGHVWVGDYDIPTLKEKELFEVRKKFGVLFQDGALFGSMNIEDNVAFPLREHTDLSDGTIRALVQEKLEIVGLAGAEKKFPAEISGGMKKRAGLARALVLEPEILLFDEPDSGLDPVRTAFLNLLAVDLKKRLGPTIIIVTHHIETARTIPDYIGLIFARKLVMFDTRENMLNSKLPVVQQFLTGSVEGPIGMSEEKDAGQGGAPVPTPEGAAAERVKDVARQRKAAARPRKPARKKSARKKPARTR